MLELVILLLPVAAASGWYVARKGAPGRVASEADKTLRSDYMEGISYLLNEQPDKAIEVFIKVLEVDSETVETHLALGNLYRRRGEVDRSIRIHQNLIARDTLSPRQRNGALLELALDYLSAGLLDRAEHLFHDLAETETYRVRALHELIEIYEQEKEWDKARTSAIRLEESVGEPYGGVIAHYYCEEAEHLKRKGELTEALQMVQEAHKADDACVRATLLEGDILADHGELEAAVNVYKRVEEQGVDYLPEVINRICRCSREAGKLSELSSYLSQNLEHHGGITALLALADLMDQQNGRRAAIEFMSEHLRRHPSVRGLARLLELQQSEPDASDSEQLPILRNLTAALLLNKSIYQCRKCGFSGKSLHWQCPSCKQWNTVKPIRGVEGE